MKYLTKKWILLKLGDISRKRFLVLGLMIVWLLVCGVLVKIEVRRNSAFLKRGRGNIVLPILMIARNGSFVEKSLRSLSYFRQNSTIFPIIVYNDPRSKEIDKAVANIANWDPTVTIVQNPNPKKPLHLKFPLNHIFSTLQHEAVIVLDDNLDISPDFFEYFLATYRLLEKDLSIWCVSAWNDNGKKELIDMTKPDLLHRTDSFPGKGWMIRHETWEQIHLHSGETFDVESLHNPAITRGRVCIRPEISRTYKFGVHKTCLIKVKEHYLQFKQNILNTRFVPFTRYNLSYLLKENENLFFSFSYSCPETTVGAVLNGTLNGSLRCVRIPYSNAAIFRMIAKVFGLMYDFRHGVARTALHGIVQCFFKGRRVFLTPAKK